MRLTPRLIILLFALGSCASCRSTSGSRTEQNELSARARQLEAKFREMHQQLGRVEPKDCPEPEILAAIRRSGSRTVPFIDEQSLALSAAGKPLDPSLPLASFASEVLAKRRPSSQANDEKTATDAAFDALSLTKQHDYMAVLRYRLTPPRADNKGFHGGELEGMLGVFELASGKLACAVQVFAQSHEEIAAKAGQTPQEAADKDLELQFRRALQEAFSSLTRELNLDVR
jgi:BMFP domain-containing protein YqiC